MPWNIHSDTPRSPSESQAAVYAAAHAPVKAADAAIAIFRVGLLRLATDLHGSAVSLNLSFAASPSQRRDAKDQLRAEGANDATD